LHGQLGFAFHAHPFGPVLYTGLTVWALLGFYGWVKRWRLDGSGPLFTRMMTAFVVVFFVFGIVRAVVSPGFSGKPEQRFVKLLAH
jgi:hypothetical protein